MQTARIAVGIRLVVWFAGIEFVQQSIVQHHADYRSIDALEQSVVEQQHAARLALVDGTLRWIQQDGRRVEHSRQSDPIARVDFESENRKRPNFLLLGKKIGRE